MMNLVKILCLSLVFTFLNDDVQAKDIKGGYSFNSYDQASDSDSQFKLSFQAGSGDSVQSVGALARSFQFQAVYDERGHALTGIQVNFDATVLDSNDRQRDGQFQTLCLPTGAQQEIKMTIDGPASFSDDTEKEYAAVTTFRGKAYSTPVKMKIHFDQNTEQMILVGSSSWALKSMGTSESCFSQGKFSDTLKVNFQLIIKANEAAN